MDFLFGCCKGDVRGECYEVRSLSQGNRVEIKYVPSLGQLTKEDYKDARQIMRVRKSQYRKLVEKFKGKKQKWTDQEFPPTAQSLGHIPTISQRCQWKRITQFIKDPKLFVDGIDPTDIIKGNLDNSYFLSAIASLAEKKFAVERVFGDQLEVNANGIYKVQMRVNGNVEEVMVDDYIPMDFNCRTFFCQPHYNQFWVLIVEKAWAKVNGGYANILNILNGSQIDVYRSLGCCPAESFHIKSSKESREKLWKFLLQYSRRNYPISCVTRDQQKNWKQSGLTQNTCYNMICAQILQDKQHQTYRMLKLRNPWSKDQWNGKGNQSDKKFWASILKDQNEKRFSDSSKQSFAGNDGVFFMPYEDFCEYFREVYVCLIEDKPMYQVQSLRPNGKNGNIYMFDVKKEDSYVIQLHQSQEKQDLVGRNERNTPCRSTIILAKGKDYEFIDGVLKHSEYDTQLRAYLDPGKYFVYCKLDATGENNLPVEASLSTYSTSFVDIKAIQKFHVPGFFRKVFLAYARQNKKKQYDNGNMWLSYKLLFQKGGFAYVAFGNQVMSDKKFVVQFDQRYRCEQFRDFNEMYYTLKRPFKGCGKKKLVIKPGEEEIIVCRVMKDSPKEMRFPPQLNISIEA